MTNTTIILNESNTFEITDEVLAIMESVLCDEEIAEESFDYSTLFDEPTEEFKAEAIREEEERVAKETAETFARLRVTYDKNKVYKDCKKCGGTGSIDCYHHVDNGRCFRCAGTGKEL